MKVGLTQDSDVSIDDGLQPGEVVVVDGAEKLAEGMSVTFRQPGNKPVAATGAADLRNESVAAVYSAAGCHVAADGGHSDCRHRRL